LYCAACQRRWLVFRVQPLAGFSRILAALADSDAARRLEFQVQGRMLLPVPDQLLIEGDGLVGDAGPGEVLLHAFAAGIAHALAGGGVFEQ
jgi:hypothetical protein